MPGIVVSAYSEGLAGAGHQGLVLVFTNETDSTCTLTGYPGVTASDAEGRKFDAARTKNGFIFRNVPGGPVTLAPYGSASAGVEWSSVPSGEQTTCTAYTELAVTPPDETQSVSLNRGVTFCGGFEVHPVIRGARGGLAG